MDQLSYQDKDEKLDVQFDQPKTKKKQRLEMASLADSGGLDVYDSNGEIYKLEKEPIDQNFSGSDY